MRHGPQFRYLLRFLLLIAPLLTLWWTLLRSPLLITLRFSTELLFRVFLGPDPPAQVTIEPGGNWSFRIPVPAVIARREEIQKIFGRASENAPHVNVHSLRLEIPGRYPVRFTVSLPFFWAMVLALRWTRRSLSVLLEGTALLLITAWLLIAFEVVLIAFEVVYSFTMHTHLVLAAFSEALFHSVDFAAINVIPYAAPVLLALALDSDLRLEIFSGEVPNVIAGSSAVPRPRSRRGRNQWTKSATRRASVGS